MVCPQIVQCSARGIAEHGSAGIVGIDARIRIVPAEDITEIQLSIKTLAGEVIFSNLIPFETTETLSIITPHMPEGFLLEIKDNNGVVYTGIEDEN